MLEQGGCGGPRPRKWWKHLAEYRGHLAGDVGARDSSQEDVLMNRCWDAMSHKGEELEGVGRVAAVFQGLSETHISDKNAPRDDKTALYPVASGWSCKGCSAAEGLFSLAQSIWGTWEGAVGTVLV